MIDVAQVISSDWLDKVPTTVGAAVLLGIIGIVTRLWLGSESRHSEELDRIERQHSAELKRYEDRYEAEVFKLRAEIAQVRTELENERKIRWRAQDVAAQRRRRVERPGEYDERGQSG
jgi:hypothetical protein